MKKLLSLALVAALFTTTAAEAQQARKSPAVTVTETTNAGAKITINYGQPSLNGRTIGVDVEPMKGKVWRMGANEATTIEINKDVLIDGQNLPAGKYSIFGVDNGDSYQLIFNKNPNIWGTQHSQNRATDILNFAVKKHTLDTPQEKLTYTIEKDGKVSLLWGTMQVSFFVQ